MNLPADSPQNGLSLIGMLRFLCRHFLIIGACTIIFMIGAGVLAFQLTPFYRAEVIVSPADSSSGLGEMGGQLGGLAALAGINIGGGSKKADEALEYLRSRTFTASFIQRHDLLPILFAKKWDAQLKHWRSDAEPPTIAEGVTKFSNKVRQLTEDRRTGIVTVGIIWSDRVAAAQWANTLIAEADDALRQRAIAELHRSIEYLKSEASQTSSTVEINAAVFKLMETELKNAMLARTRDAYAFKVLDPAVVRDPKDRDSPNKPLIVALGAGVGFSVGIVAAGLRRRNIEPLPR